MVAAVRGISISIRRLSLLRGILVSRMIWTGLTDDQLGGCCWVVSHDADEIKISLSLHLAQKVDVI